MESVNKKVILIAVILAFITTFLVYAYIKKMTTKSETTEYVNVYIASKTLPPKQKIGDGDIKQIKVGKEMVNPKAIQNKAEIVGARTVDRIIEGEQILKERLAADETMTLSFEVPEGMRAVSMNVNEQINVANLVRPGDFIDVIASFDKEETEENGVKKSNPKYTKTIMQKILVLAVGQDRTSGESIIKDPPKTITLAVNPKDVEKLAYVSDFANVRLSLRPVGEEGSIKSEGVFRDNVILN